LQALQPGQVLQALIVYSPAGVQVQPPQLFQRAQVFQLVHCELAILQATQAHNGLTVRLLVAAHPATEPFDRLLDSVVCLAGRRGWSVQQEEGQEQRDRAAQRHGWASEKEPSPAATGRGRPTRPRQSSRPY